jgi:hypothetical protein
MEGVLVCSPSLAGTLPSSAMSQVSPSLRTIAADWEVGRVGSWRGGCRRRRRAQVPRFPEGRHVGCRSSFSSSPHRVGRAVLPHPVSMATPFTDGVPPACS